ncbi:MAG: YdhR family protein [Myxococcota bacterium]
MNLRTVLVAALLLMGSVPAFAADTARARPPLGQRLASGAASLMMRGIAAGYAAEFDRLSAASATTDPVLVQVNFRFNEDPARFAARMDQMAPFLSHVPGLQWKVWSYNPDDGTANGTYLFDDTASAQMYLSEILPRGFDGDKRISDVDIQTFSVLPIASTMTHATRVDEMWVDEMWVDERTP